MITLLCGMNQAKKRIIEQGETTFTKEERRDYDQQYYDLLRRGWEEIKTPPINMQKQMKGSC